MYDCQLKVLRMFISLRRQFEYVLIGKLTIRRVIRRKVRPLAGAIYSVLGRLRFHYDNDNEYENDN